MANAIIDQNCAKNWDTAKTLSSLPFEKEKQKSFVIVKLARNITLLICAKVLSFFAYQRAKGTDARQKGRLTKMFKRGLT